MFNPIPTTHPSVNSGTWTKVNTIPGKSRLYFMCVNEDQAVVWRYERVATGGTPPSGATAGVPLNVGYANGGGGVYEENENSKRSSGDIYVYQASGSPKTSLGVSEGN